MKIVQDRTDGSAEILFNENEIKIIQKNKKLILEPSTMKAFCNHLANIAAQFNLNLKKYENQRSFDNEEIEAK